MPTFQIVRLPPEDWPLYKQIRLEALREEPQAFGSSYAAALQQPDAFWQGRLVDARAGEKSWLLFAREEERLIGLTGAYRPEEDQGVVDIVSVYVTQKKRGQGVASALMSAILEEVSRDSAFCKARLTVTASQTAAVALYHKFGFQIVGEKTGVMGDGISRAGYIMEKKFILHS